MEPNLGSTHCAVRLGAIQKNFPRKHPFKVNAEIEFFYIARQPGLPDFSWCMILKTWKNVPDEHKMYQMAIKFPKSQ
jgi:hypothetical protein